jgi:hypothetical protein
MRSNVFLEFNDPIPLDEWLSFCSENRIEYSPRTVGRNVFYRGDTQITFGESPGESIELPRLPSGELDFGQAKPPDRAARIIVSTYWMGNLEGVADVAKRILSHWPGSVLESSPELASRLSAGGH